MATVFGQQFKLFDDNQNRVERVHVIATSFAAIVLLVIHESIMSVFVFFKKSKNRIFQVMS